MKNVNLLVISNYPVSYTKNALFSLYSLLKKKGRKPNITVFAKTSDGETTSHKEKGLKIVGLWEKDSFFTFPRLLKEIYKNYKQTPNILIEADFQTFGNKFHLIPFLFFVILLRIIGKKLFFVVRQAVSDIRMFEGNIDLYQTSFSIDLSNLILKTFYRLILKSATKVIVFEDIFKEQLAKFGSEEKICVIPYGVEKYKELPSKNYSRKKLNIPQKNFVVLLFGFLDWNKGTDWIIEIFKKIKKDNSRFNKSNSKISLIIAGGANPNHLGKRNYRKYISNIKNECQKHGIILTGFIPKQKLPLYYQASDAILLPYRTLTSTSGPLSIAFSFQKPFLVSENLSKMLETKDLKNTLSVHKIDKKELIFELNSELIRKIKLLVKRKNMLKKLKLFSKSMGKIRNWENTGKHYYQELFS